MLDDQLVEPLVLVPARRESAIEVLLAAHAQPARLTPTVGLPSSGGRRPQALQQRPDRRRSGGPSPSGSGRCACSRGEVPHALGVLVAVGVGVEVPRAVVAGLLEQLDQEEGVLDVLRAEAQVLVVAADLLAVEVDVEELAVPERLGDARGRSSGPAIVSWATSGLRPTISGCSSVLDEGQGVADGRQEDVAARLVRLGLQREAHRVALSMTYLAEEVDRLAVAVERVGTVSWPPSTSTPSRPPQKT